MLNYKEISVIARKRRDDALASYYPLSPVAEDELPKNLTGYHRSSGLFSADELRIIESSVPEILVNIREKTWSSTAVTKAFCKASTLAQQLTNCVTEVLFSEALERARFLDDYLEKNGSVIGPLHGLPISLKDCFITPPHPSSIGMAAFSNEPTDTESVLPKLLRSLGAVFYVKTNVPTAMMMMETDNNIWGATRNPLHKGLSPGGSSGGEAALVRMHGSPIGIGTDIGGSIRIPSAFCHLYGLKPSFGRFPVYGGKSGIPGQDFIYAINGPMSRSLESLKAYCEAVLSEEAAPWHLDPKAICMPWRKDVIQPKGRKLRFGILGPKDGSVTCHPPVERALDIVKKALEDAGHDVVEWAPVKHPEITELLEEAFFTFGGDGIMALLDPYEEPVFEAMKPYEEYAKKGDKALNPARLREMILKRGALQKEYLDRWAATAEDQKPALDGIIAPVSQWAAPKLSAAQKHHYIGYTGVFNLLDYPSCTFPVTFADASVDRARENFKPLNKFDESLQAEYDADFYDGAPVSLQLVGRRLEEEKVLEMVDVVSSLLRT